MDTSVLILAASATAFIGGVCFELKRRRKRRRIEADIRRKDFEKAWQTSFFNQPESREGRLLKIWFTHSDYMSAGDFDTLQKAWLEGAQLARRYPDDLFQEKEGLTDARAIFVDALLAQKKCPDEKARRQFNRDWCQKARLQENSHLVSPDGRAPNESQAIAALDNDDRTLVLAGAGTGKTATIVTKTRYLIKSGRATAEEILLLAYNRDAAREMLERIHNELGTGVDVKTFHSFGNALLKRFDQEKRAISNLIEQPSLFDRFVLDVVRNLAHRDADYAESLLNYFVDHAAPLEVESAFKSQLEATLFLRSHNLTAFAGERVKSGGELMIANLLYYWQVPYAYEARYPVRDFAYKPDFLVSDIPFKGDGGQWKNGFSTLAEGAKTAWIEYFGIDARGRTAPWIDTERYNAQRKGKIALHRRSGTKLIELTTADLIAGQLKDKLLAGLKNAGIPIRPMGTARFCLTLWREESELHPRWRHFLDLVRSFLPLLKESGMTLDEVSKEAAMRQIDMDRLEAFLKVFNPILQAYEDRLHEENELDFGDMIVEATAMIRKGLNFPYKYILVDEFQDISRSRAEMLKALLESARRPKLFAVGDDWQSIYRFSGSDTGYVTTFFSQFGKGTALELDTTYRYPEELNRLTADFVTKNPHQLRKNMHAPARAGYPTALMRDVRSLVPVAPDQTEEEKRLARSRFPQSLAYARAVNGYLTQFAKKAAERGGRQNRVMIVGRRRWENMPCLKDALPLAKLQARFPSLQIDYKTAHSAKGLEADYVILIGNEAEIFPSEREGDQIVEAVLPRPELFPFAEERRLFYVAMTRAKHFLVILYDGERESLFVSELRASMPPELLTRVGEVPVFLCPHCGLGMLSEAQTRDGKTFYTCTNTATCGRLFFPCQDCGSPVADDEKGRYCLNKACKNVALHCPQCSFGFLKKRHHGETKHAFYGCTNWKNMTGVSCTYTADIGSVENALKRYKKAVEKNRLELPGA